MASGRVNITIRALTPASATVAATTVAATATIGGHSVATGRRVNPATVQAAASIPTPGTNPGPGFIVTATGTSGGAGTNASPWSLAYAAAGAGGVIQPGHKVYLRDTGGPFQSTTGWNISVSGTLANPVTFEGYPGDNVVVDGAIRAFVDTPATAWEVVSLATGKNIYRSTATYPSGEYSGLIQIGGEFYTLPGSGAGRTYLEANTDLVTLGGGGAANAYYMGPSFTWDSTTGRIYIRLDNNSSTAQLGRSVTQFTDFDPRNHQIWMSTHDTYGIRVDGSHVIVKNLPNINYYYGCLTLSPGGAGQVNVVLDNTGGRTQYFGIRCGNVGSGSGTGLLMQNCKFYAHLPIHKWWIDWMSVKGAPEAASRARKCAIMFDNALSTRVTNCEFYEFWDGALSSDNIHDIEVDHCLFKDTVDDGWQMNSSLYRINVHHNTFIGAGPSHYGIGSGSANADPGTVYIHHNIIDTTKQLIFWGRPGWGGSDEGVYPPIALSLHGSITGFANPWKFYHNTVLTPSTFNGKIVYIGADYFGNVSASNFQAAHEVFNNIFATASGVPIGRDLVTNSGWEIYDGNVYWHYQSSGSTSGYKSPFGAFLHTSAGTVDPQAQAITTVSQLRAHGTVLADTQVYYAPGWEASGLSVDPALDSSYRPTTSSVLTGAVNITAKPWPDTTTYEAYRGAVAP